MREAPVHRRLHDELLARIRKGEWHPGDRFLSENEVIAAYQVSSTTARRALYDLTREGWLTRIQGKGSFVADPSQLQKTSQPDREGAAAEPLPESQVQPVNALAGQAQGQVLAALTGVVFPTPSVNERLLDDFYFGQLLRGLRLATDETGANLLLLSLPEAQVQEDCVRAYRQLLEHHPDLADLVLFAPPADQGAAVAELARRREPFTIVVGAHWSDMPVVWVDSDNRTSGREIARYLLELGHRRVAGVFGLEVETNSRDRADGFRETLAAAGVDPLGRSAGGGQWLQYRPGESVWPDNFAQEVALRWLSLPAGQRPTAIFAGGQGLAIGVLRAVRQLGISIPEQLSLVGFDDAVSLHWLEVFDPPLTTVRQPLPAMGHFAGRLLRLRDELERELTAGVGQADGRARPRAAPESAVDRLIRATDPHPLREGKRGFLFPNELVIRGSAAPPPDPD